MRGNRFCLRANQSNSDNLTYSWYNSSKEKIGSTASITITEKGNYTVEVVNGLCKAFKGCRGK